MKQGLLMTALVLLAIVGGSLLGQVCVEVPDLEWIGHVYEFGFDTFTMHLQILDITVGTQIHVCIAQMFLVMVALLCYPKLKKLIIG
ncbi:MAG: DUF4321 domain-containing protein [Oscillospiraceae bacterium]|nr:DUF4321 domain-containing protein [Oscillospiraceae bacterium]